MSENKDRGWVQPLLSRTRVGFGEGNGTPLQYSCLENPMDGGAWWATVHGVAKSRTRLSDFTFTFHFHALEKEMATHSSVLAWRIPEMGEPGGLPSMGSHRVGHNWSDLAAAAAFLTRNQLSWLQAIPQSYSHQDSMVLAPKQKYRPMEQGRKPRNKSMCLLIPYFSQRRQEYTMAKREPLQ